MRKLNLVENGVVEIPFDETKPFIEVTDEEYSKLQSGLLKVKNGTLINCESEINKQRKIQELKQLLSSTDYKAIKFAEGLITPEEYYSVREQRKLWREQINNLEDAVD